MTRTLKQALILHRPGDVPQIVKDPAYDRFKGFKGVFSDGDEPSQETLLNADDSKITSVTHWATYGSRLNKDFISIRAKVYRAMLTSGGFDALEHEEQLICCEYFVVEETVQARFFIEEELAEMSKQYDLNAMEARRDRYETAKVLLYRSFKKFDAQHIAKEILSAGLDREYIVGGVLGVASGDREESLLDYINATPDTEYEDDGLRTRDYILRDGKGTVEEFCDQVIAIAMKDLV